MERQQRRGRVIAMTAEELDAFLGEQRTCRFATTGPDGPHVAPVWFVWDGQAIWVYSLTRSQRWANLSRDPRVAVVVHDGRHAWLRVTPQKMVSWDFRKLATLG